MTIYAAKSLYKAVKAQLWLEWGVQRCSSVSSSHVDLPNPNTMTAEFQGVRGAKGSELALEIGEIFKYLDVASSLGFWKTKTSLNLYLKIHWLSPAHPLTLGQQITGVLTTGSVGTDKEPRQPSHSSRITINISFFMSHCGPRDE